MTPNDPRHGTRAGYQAHARDGEPACRACLRGRARQDKSVRFDHHNGVRFDYTPDEVAAVLNPWLAQGLSYHAIGDAAGIGGKHGSRLAVRLAENRTFRRSTYEALAAVTEDAFDGRALVFAHLTRARVFSLMAAGHRLVDVPILATGQWRDREHVSVDQARTVRDYYATHQHTPGDHPRTATKARNRGYRPPAAWDDPGTLGWPLGWTQPLVGDASYDEAVVELVHGGAWRHPATPAERTEIARRWVALGRPLRELQNLTGWKPERYYKLSDDDRRRVA